MRYLSLLIISFLLLNCAQETPDSTYNPENDTLRYEGEKHFRNIQQLTFGANNAEAYWGFDDEALIFQSDNPEWDVNCDQIFT